MDRKCQLLLSFFGCLSLSATPCQARSPDFWLAAPTRAQEGYVLFLEKMISWDPVARKSAVFQVYISDVNKVSDARLSKMIQVLRSSGIKLAVATSILDKVPGCDFKEAELSNSGVIEGFRRLHDLGGVVDYVVMDEPVWFGTTSQSTDKCFMTGDELAHSAANNLSFITRLFPHIVIGDVEPTKTKPLLMQQFYSALKQRHGFTVSFLHADVIWTTPLTEGAREIDWSSDLRRFRGGVPGVRSFGVVVDGGSWKDQNALWEHEALDRYRIVRSLKELNTDTIIFQSWKRFPDKYLPISEPGTMMHFAFTAMNETSP